MLLVSGKVDKVRVPDWWCQANCEFNACPQHEPECNCVPLSNNNNNNDNNVNKQNSNQNNNDNNNFDYPTFPWRIEPILPPPPRPIIPIAWPFNPYRRRESSIFEDDEILPDFISEGINGNPFSFDPLLEDQNQNVGS